MPTYDYACKACGHRFEEFQSMTAEPLTMCPTCSTSSLQRLIGAGAGLLFKGSGFYLTDYKSTKTSPSESSGSNGSGESATANTSTTPASGTGSAMSTAAAKSSGTESPATKS